MNGAFTLMDFQDPEDPDMVHVETYVGSKYIEKPADVERFRKILTRLTDRSVPIEEYTP